MNDLHSRATGTYQAYQRNDDSTATGEGEGGEINGSEVTGGGWGGGGILRAFTCSRSGDLALGPVMTQRLQLFRDAVNFVGQRGPAVAVRGGSAGQAGAVNVAAGSRVRRDRGAGGRRGEHGHLLRTNTAFNRRRARLRARSIAVHVESVSSHRARRASGLSLFFRFSSSASRDATSSDTTLSRLSLAILLRARTLFLFSFRRYLSRRPAQRWQRRRFLLIGKRDTNLESLAVHPARALPDEREEEMPAQFIGRVDLQIRIQELAEALVIDVLKQPDEEMRFIEFLRESDTILTLFCARRASIHSTDFARHGDPIKVVRKIRNSLGC